MSTVDVIVIGGGPAGLGAAYRLARQPDVDWLLFEAEPVFGGLSRSFVDDAGFTWDVGGHVCFSHYDFVTEALQRALGPGGWFEHRREAWVRMMDSWIPYPFQNNIHRLPPVSRERCLRGLEAAAAARGRSGRRPIDYATFIQETFGSGIAELFMVPYNEKVWAYPLDRLSCDWIGERVSVPDPAAIAARAASATDDVDWGPNARFIFPKSGGTGAFWEAVAGLLPPERVRLNAEVISIDAKARKIELRDGTVHGYRHLVSTVPLDLAAHLTDDADLIELTAGLLHSSVHVLGLGVDASVGQRLGSRCWVYFPGADAPFYRVTNFSHYSPAHVPHCSDRSSLLIEVSESTHRRVDRSALLENVVRGLVSTGILDDPGQVSHSWSYRAEHAYPTPTLGRDGIVNKALVRLESEHILSRGRFGAWRYEVGNMDHSFAQGYEAAERILTGSAEVTVNDARAVNG